MVGYDPLGRVGLYRDLLEPALLEGTWRDVVKAVAIGNAQLWIADGAAMVTRKDGHILEIWLCGGKVLNRLEPCLDTIGRAAFEAGMNKMRITGRRGWGKHLLKWGWVKQGDDVIKELKYG